MKTVTVYRRDGSEAGTVDLPEDIFGVEPSIEAVHQVVTAHLANRRQGTASSLQRNEVNVSKSKLYRQKGTGRARVGSANSPTRVGGAAALGPKPRTYVKRLNKKVRHLALKSAYSIKAIEDGIRVVEDFTLDAPKTKDMVSMFKLIGADNQKTVFLLGARDDVIYKSSRNIKRVSVNCVSDTSTYDIMNSDMLVFTRSAIDRVKEVFEG